MLATTAILLAALILAVAALYASVGHAGASGYLAAMALLGVAPGLMKPTSLSLNILVAVITTVTFIRARHFSWPLFWPFAAASIPCAFIGGAFTLPGQWFRPLIGLILLFSAARLVLARTSGDNREPRPPERPMQLAVGAALGLLSGLAGTGGGIFLSPILLLTGWAGIKQTAATSAAFILVNSISGLAGLLLSTRSCPPDLIRWGPLWAAAALLGGASGAFLGANQLRTPTLRRLLAAVLIIAGLKLVLAF